MTMMRVMEHIGSIVARVLRRLAVRQGCARISGSFAGADAADAFEAIRQSCPCLEFPQPSLPARPAPGACASPTALVAIKRRPVSFPPGNAAKARGRRGAKSGQAKDRERCRAGIEAARDRTGGGCPEGVRAPPVLNHGGCVEQLESICVQSGRRRM